MLNLPARYFPAASEAWPEQVAFLLMAGSVSLVLVSIAASQVLLAGAVLAALPQWKRARNALCLPGAILWPLLILFLWTLVAAFAASGSIRDAFVRKFFLFFLLLIVPILARGAGKVAWTYHAVFAVATVSAAAGLVQFLINPHRDALHRIQGFMSIWMTYSGLLMLVLVALTAYAVTIGWKRHLWLIPVGLAQAAALYLSQTRSAWLGAVAGIALIFLLKRPRAIIGLVVLLLAVYLFSPASIQQRLRGGWNPQDSNTRNRIEVFGTALRLIRAHPWAGVGQNVSREALAYRGTHEFPDYLYIHMHNNLLQIAAERGIPGLAIWVWLMIQLAWQAFGAFRAAGTREAAFAAAAAIGGWVALMVSGMFEYNFGDSEVLTLFLFIMSAPYATRATNTE